MTAKCTFTERCNLDRVIKLPSLPGSSHEYVNLNTSIRKEFKFIGAFFRCLAFNLSQLITSFVQQPYQLPDNNIKDFRLI